MSDTGVVIDASRRRIVLAALLTAVFIVSLDSSVLNVAIPTILRDFGTTLPALQWVITGYSLTFASLLIIGGRLADIWGPRRMFAIGASLFALGSFVAAVSTGVLMLVIGEAVIEGIGASLMIPSSLALLSRTFQGADRGPAFGMWTATMGVGSSFGPLIGGFLTTNHSWRWAFVVNVVVAPLAIAGVLWANRPEPRRDVREPIDVPGALLISSGMALLVFGISQGETYGWWVPARAFVVGGVTVWPSDAPISIVPSAFAAAVLLLGSFLVVERAKERRGAWPLFELSQLRNRGFRYGLSTLLFLAMGQAAFTLILSVLLQNSRNLSAFDTGLWLVPSGLAIVVGARVGGQLTRRIETVWVARIGVATLTIGLAITSWVISPVVTLLALVPCFVLFGFGHGFSSSQITNLILRDVPPDRSGAASGANSTVRNLGWAFGVASVSAIMSAFTVHYAVERLQSAERLTEAVRADAIAQVREDSVNYEPPTATPPDEAAVLEGVLDESVADAARQAMRFTTALVSLGFGVSFLIPGEARRRRHEAAATAGAPLP